MPGGKKPGPSIKNPATYEALKKKGLSKESAAAISNWAVGQGYKKGVHHKSHDEDDDYEAVDGWLTRDIGWTEEAREAAAAARWGKGQHPDSKRPVIQTKRGNYRVSIWKIGEGKAAGRAAPAEVQRAFKFGAVKSLMEKSGYREPTHIWNIHHEPSGKQMTQGTTSSLAEAKLNGVGYALHMQKLYGGAADSAAEIGDQAMRDRQFSASRREELAKKGLDAKPCPKCDGAGNVNGFKCDRCDGEGYVGIPESQQDELPPQFSCPECHGTGKDPDDDSGSTECDMCNGEGSIPSPERGLSRMLRRNKPASPYPDGALHVDRKSKRSPPDDDDDEDEEEADIYRDAKRSNEHGIEETPDDDDDAEEMEHGPGVMRRRGRRTRDSIALIVDGGKVRRTKDGYLVADARIARTGIQLYDGKELGRSDLGMVRVYRSPSEVFSRRAMRSLAGKPVTLNHPPKMIDADNWEKFSIGHIGEDIARDGETVRVPMMIMDGKAIRAYERDGVKELSVGYSTELKWGRGTTPEGEIYDAKQTAIRANHLAVVPAARGGSRLRIGDDHKKEVHKMVQVLIGDRLVSFEDETEAQHVQAHIKSLTDARKRSKDKEEAGPGPAEEEQEEEKKTRGERDAALGQIAVLRKQLEDANTKLSGGELDKIVKARTELMIKADAIMEGRAEFSGKEPAEIQRMVVAAKLGDAIAKTMVSDEAIAGAFQALAANVKPRTGVNRLADNLALLNLGGGGVNDAKAIKDAAYDGYVKRQTEAWRTVGRTQ